jgi:recombinational DNA repair protein (RecF pathway)
VQGFIVNLNRVKEEDLIVNIITKGSLDTLYRFYGARHSVINLGFKLDYEKEPSSKSTISRLKDVLHIGYPWIYDPKRLHLWQQFILLFYKHLQEAQELGDFYFTLLDDAATIWDKQNPKRIAVESYVKLLEHEGRLHNESYCFLCSRKIEGDISLIRAYLPTHPACSHTYPINKKALYELYKNKSSIFLSDKEIERLWFILLEGL